MANDIFPEAMTSKLFGGQTPPPRFGPESASGRLRESCVHAKKKFTGRVAGHATFWDRDAEDLLTGLLLAAAVAEAPISRVGNWLTAVSSVEPRNHLVRAGSRSSGRTGGTSTSVRRERVLAADEVRALPKFTALLLVTGVRPALLRLVPWMAGAHADAIRAAGGQAANEDVDLATRGRAIRR